MQSFNSGSFEQILSLGAFERLEAALGQLAQDLSAAWFGPFIDPLLAVRAADLALDQFDTDPSGSPASPGGSLRLALLISPRFSALLWGKQDATGAYQTRLWFDPASIRAAVAVWSSRFKSDPPDWSQIQPKLAEIQPNDSQIQSQFTLRLVSLLSPVSHPGSHPVSPSLQQASDSERALRQQLAQEQLLNQVTSQIRQSLELPIILKTAVEQVRQLLQVDRLVIYQLNAPVNTASQPFDLPASGFSAEQMTTQYGSVIYESRASEAIPSVMHLSDAHCFMEELRHQNWQGLDMADAIEDIEVQYRSLPCLLEFLRQAQVRAKLIAPIRLHGLWGLLIAHACNQPRQWQPDERRFLQQTAENLAIAIAQAQLYSELQQQKQTLEARVIERTQALQAALLAAQAANQAKSDFLATVSHELRTPLTCIIGMSATLQRWSGSLTQRQQQFLTTIHQSGEHLLALINDILDLSQVETGRIRLNVQPFSLEGLARQTLNAFNAQAKLQGIELALEVQTASSQLCMADPRRVRQIMTNLLSNAIKFTPASGKVTLSLRSAADGVTLEVKDTGIGIPEALRPLLFQKFQQLDSGRRREYQGTGLGLALTLHLVELHQGTIEVESATGLGSTFTVKLPCLTPSTALTLPSLKQKRVVLIEPNEASAEFICALLLAADCQVIWILEGLAAVKQLEVIQPAAILLNSQLPDIDGLHLVHSLRQNLGTRDLKILALLWDWPAQQADLESVTAAWRQAGAAAWIAHPMQGEIQPELLVETVKALLS